MTPQSASSGRLVDANGREGGVNEIVDVGVALRIADLERARGAIALGGQLLTSQLRVKVAADELEDRIGRVFFRQRTGNLQGLLVLLIVVVEIDGQVETRLGRSEDAFGNGALQLLNAFLFASAGDAHEEPKHAGEPGERVGIVVVKTETGVSVGEIGVQSDGPKQTFARADASARGVARFRPQTVKACQQRVSHAGIELHLGSIVKCDSRLGERRSFRRQIQVVLIGGQLSAVARIGHAISEFGGSAPNFPPQGFAFEQVTERVLGLIALKAAGAFHGRSEIAGINLIDDGDGGWRQIEMCAAERRGGGECDAEQQQGIAQNGRHCGSDRRNRRNLP